MHKQHVYKITITMPIIITYVPIYKKTGSQKFDYQF